MRKTVFIIGLFILFPICLSAQTAAELEVISKAPSVTCSQAAWVVLSSTGSRVTAGAAFEQAVSNGWLKAAASDDPITLSSFSFLIMKAYDMKGSLMYTIFPGPRYAYRSMVSQSYIQGRTDPSMKVSGEQALFILGKVLSEQGGES